MTARFRIRLTQPSNPGLVNRLRNLGEALDGVLVGKGRVDMQEVDAATEFFFVEVSEKRYLGDVGVLLNKSVIDREHGDITAERA